MALSNFNIFNSSDFYTKGLFYTGLLMLLSANNDLQLSVGVICMFTL